MTDLFEFVCGVARAQGRAVLLEATPREHDWHKTHGDQDCCFRCGAVTELDGSYDGPQECPGGDHGDSD